LRVSQTILVVEDEPQIVAVLHGYLTDAGFEVIKALDGRTGLQKVQIEHPDLVILDLMLPKMDGIDVARAIRQDPDPRVSAVPLIMLTARAGEADKLIGLELGADDYIVKPFSPREVVARVRALLRRLDRTEQLTARVYRRGPLTVDRNRRMVHLDDTPIDLTPTEFDLLATMINAPGRPFSRMELLDATAGDAYEGYERTIDVHIKNLRRKLGDSGRSPRFIETVLHHGYRFAADLGEA
jgi:DNA-binding response OmpR family regulator